MAIDDDIQEHRKARLLAAVAKAGGKAALGRLLGYRDGAYVGQMLRGERPIKEDTVLKLEAKPGYAGWFGAQTPTLQAAPRDLDDAEHELLAAFRLLDSVGRADMLAKAVQLALEQQPAIALMMESAGVSRRADDTAVLEWWHRTQQRVPREIKEAPSLHGEGGLVGGAAALKKHKAA